MIRFILLQNRAGKTRLAKYYIPLEESEKHKVHRLVVNKFTNFVELLNLSMKTLKSSFLEWEYQRFKILAALDSAKF